MGVGVSKICFIIRVLFEAYLICRLMEFKMLYDSYFQKRNYYIAYIKLTGE